MLAKLFPRVSLVLIIPLVLAGCFAESSTSVATSDMVVRYTVTQAWTQNFLAPPVSEPPWTLLADLKAFRPSLLTAGGGNVVLNAPETITLTIQGQTAPVALVKQEAGDPELQEFLRIFGDESVYAAQLAFSEPAQATATFYRANGEVIATPVVLPANQVVTLPGPGQTYSLSDSFQVAWNVNPEFEDVELRLFGCGIFIDYLRTDNTGSAVFDLTNGKLPDGINECPAVFQVVSRISRRMDQSFGYHPLSHLSIELVSALIPMTITR